MKRWGRVVPAAAVACAMLALAGCSQLRDIVVSGSELSRALHDVPDIHIPASDIKGAADSASVSAGTWRDTAENIGESSTWDRITGNFEAIDLAMGESTREVALKSACDMLFQKIRRQAVTPEHDVAKNLPLPGPPYQETLEAANSAYTVLLSHHADGDEKDEAAVSVTCYIANKEWNILVHNHL
jgi:hypothetical protein